MADGQIRRVPAQRLDRVERGQPIAHPRIGYGQGPVDPRGFGLLVQGLVLVEDRLLVATRIEVGDRSIELARVRVESPAALPGPDERRIGGEGAGDKASAWAGESLCRYCGCLPVLRLARPEVCRLAHGSSP